MLVAAVILAAVVVAAWFPASALLHQRQQLASATTHLVEVRHEDAQLHHEVEALDTPAEIERIAQEQYELVLPGQQAFQVLPPSSTTSGAGKGATAAGAATPATPSTRTGSTTPATKTTGTPGKATAKGATKTTRTTAASSGSSPGFFGRVLRTLEFWR